MERLTVKRKDGRWALANNDGASPLKQMGKILFAIDRLAEYEDTGLTPDEIMALCEMDNRSRMAKMLRLEQAEDEGRLLCKAEFIELLQKASIHAVYEAVLKTGGSKETFIAAKEGIKQRFENFDLTRMQAEAALQKEKP